MVPSGEMLDGLILDTMKTISDLVGATLGPGGKVVGIERQEFGIPDLVTKDGVTVFRNMGFDNPVRHSIMTLARDASVRTASEAGDGTTTATVLSEAFVRLTHAYCKANPKVSPQRVVRTLERLFRKDIEPLVRALAMPVDNKTLRAVAMCSTNGDQELTDAIAQCFNQTGDEGNVTLTEASGPSGYKVEALKGYPLNTGFEDCVKNFFTIFMNDSGNNRVYMEKPLFVLYNGTVMDLANIYPILHKIGLRWEADKSSTRNIVIVANGFSDQVLGDLAQNWPDLNSLNIYPLTTPRNAMISGQIDLLADLSAVTGSRLLDPVSSTAASATLDDIGPPLDYFEATRYRSLVVGHADPDLLMARVEEVEAQIPQAEGEVEVRILNERKGKLTGGIAKLIISAPTSGELREKRDRAEDAACAWRGAVKHGALPGGGWTLLMVAEWMKNEYLPLAPAWYKPWARFNKQTELADIITKVVIPALEEPVKRLLSNAGFNKSEVRKTMKKMRKNLGAEAPIIFDALEGEFKAAGESGVIDSLPAVLEALRNSISIAAQLGTLGGTIVFPRDVALEREQAAGAYDYYAAAGMK